MSVSLAEAVREGVVVLDGGLATQLEARGHDLSDHLWSARLLVEDPAAVVAAHRDFVNVGARLVISASYQVSFSGFATAGLSRADAVSALRRSVTCAREAIDVGDGVTRWVAASVGPYAAALADGSEYRADHGLSVRELREWHRPRLGILCESGPDLLAIETIAGVAEAEAILAEVAGSGIPAWVSMTCAGGRLRSGEDPTLVWELARDVAEVVAVGVNCTDPHEVAALIPPAAQVSGKPVVVYPNSGEVWDGSARRWTGRPALTHELAESWVAAGARLLGGCCRVTPADIAGLVRIFPADAG